MNLTDAELALTLIKISKINERAIKRRSAKRDRRIARDEIMEAMHDEGQRGEP